MFRRHLGHPGELLGSGELGGVPHDLLEHPVGVVHLLLLNFPGKEGLVLESFRFCNTFLII